MERVDVKIGQKVRVVSAAGFYTHNIGKEGVVFKAEGVSVYIRFSGGEEDYGYAQDLELLTDSKPEAVTIKEAIANVETALEVLKALVG